MNISLRVLAGIAVVGAAAAVPTTPPSGIIRLRAENAGCTPWNELSLKKIILVKF